MLIRVSEKWKEFNLLTSSHWIKVHEDTIFKEKLFLSKEIIIFFQGHFHTLSKDFFSPFQKQQGLNLYFKKQW